VETRRLAETFEDLDSSLEQLTSKLWNLQSGMKLAAQCMISKYDVLAHQLPTC